MRVILVTGRLMESRVREIAQRHGHGVFEAPVDIAAFIKTDHLKNISGCDLILMPGYSNADLDEVEQATGIKTVKGPKDVANLELVLENLGILDLSKTTPACEMLKKTMMKRALSEIMKVDSKRVREGLLKRPGNLTIGGLATGKDFPMRVVAEIVDADLMTDTDAMERGKYFLGQGADIIDIGVSRVASSRVSELIKTLRGLNVPLSIDTMAVENIRVAIEAGADMILSVDTELIKELPQTDIPVVVVPGRNRFSTAEDRLAALHENIELARSRGFTNIIADPILEPIGFGASDSIEAYLKLGKKDKIPMLMGVGNVTELTDADSIGINATLAGFAMECGVSLLFTTEASNKTRGCVKELKAASYMMYLAKNRSTAPKDLGIDLLRYKEKRRTEGFSPVEARKVRAKRCVHKPDPSGDFTIVVDDRIHAVHTRKGSVDMVVEGEKAREVCDTILSLGRISELGHALYLGRELEKAEIALRTGRSYVQEDPLF